MLVCDQLLARVEPGVWCTFSKIYKRTQSYRRFCRRTKKIYNAYSVGKLHVVDRPSDLRMCFGILTSNAALIIVNVAWSLDCQILESILELIWMLSSVKLTYLTVSKLPSILHEAYTVRLALYAVISNWPERQFAVRWHCTSIRAKLLALNFHMDQSLTCKRKRTLAHQLLQLTRLAKYITVPRWKEPSWMTRVP